MISNLKWIKDLAIGYDSSTFDSDPFEPQPDGVNTIFPFWVPAPGSLNVQRSSTSDLRLPTSHDDPRGGYIELPYTLPQDSTLFLVLREKTIEIWKRKLDWIAEHGGMALVNVAIPITSGTGDTAIGARPLSC